MKNMKPVFVLAAILFISLHVTAQNREEKKYALRAQEVEAEVLGAADPMFSVNTVPVEYDKASAVILAKKVDLFSDLKSKVKFSIFYGRDVTNTIRYALTIREKVKLQDKNALEEYQEFSFKKIRSQSSFYRNASYTFYGLTVIKPDGSKKKINIDEEAVNAGDEDEKNKFKVAIPGLEVGDVIDFYSRVEKESSSENPIEPLDIVLGGVYPVVNFSLDTKIRNDFAVIYSTNDKTPEPNQTRDEDFINLKIDMKNINSPADALWLYDRRELPVFKINILPGVSSQRNKKFAPEKGQVIKGLPKEWIDAELANRMMYSVLTSDVGLTVAAMAKEYINKIKKEKNWKQLDKDSLITYLYYFGRYSYLYDYMSEDKLEIGTERNSAGTGKSFYSYLFTVFNNYGIDYDILFTTSKTAGTIQTAVTADDFVFLVRAKGKTDYYLVAPTMYTPVNTFSWMLEGQDAYVFKHLGLRKPVLKSEVEKIPFTNADFNYSHEDIDVSLDKSNAQQLVIQRSKLVRGNDAYENQVFLSLFQEYVDAERTKLGERTFSEEIVARVGKKRSGQLLQEYEQAFNEARKKRDEFAKKEIENSLDIKPVSFTDFKVLQDGNRHDQRDFTFSEKFLVDGLVKRAGNNYIIDAGSLIGQQLQIKNDQRQRIYNIYMPFARTFSYKVSINIPEGYTVEGLQKLNKSVENEAGRFISTAVEQGNKIVMTINKTYNHSYEEAANWPKMLAFVEAGYDFSKEKILLKKK